MKLSKCGEYGEFNAEFNVQRMEELNCFRCLGVDLCSDGEMKANWMRRLCKCKKVAGTFKKIW